MKKQNSGFTALGFSKSSFSCCSHFQICEMGKLECAIEDRDPEAKEYCNCYLRHRRTISNTKGAQEYKFIVSEDGQMSFF